MKSPLDDIDKQHPFKVPDEYFEQLTSKIQDRVYTNQKSTTWASKSKWMIVPAALSTMLAIWIGVFFIDTHSPSAEDLLSEVNEVSILEYLADDEISILELAAVTGEHTPIFNHEPNYLKGIDLNSENMDLFLNDIDLNELYL